MIGNKRLLTGCYRSNCFNWQEKMKRLVGQCDKAVSFVKGTSRIVLCINKQTDDTGLPGYQNRPMYGLCKQKLAILFPLLLARYRQACKTDGREAMVGIFLCVSGRKFFGCDFA